MPAQPPAAAAADRFPEAGIGVVVEAPGEVEADPLMVVPEPPRLALGRDHPSDERLDGTAVGAVGGVGGEGDVDLVGDLQAGHAPHRPELAHHAPDEAQPPGDVTVVGRRGVVAHLQLHLEAHAGEVPRQALEAPDARAAVLHEEAVEAHREEPSPLQLPKCRVALGDLLGDGGHRLPGAALAGQARPDAEAQARPGCRPVVRIALPAFGVGPAGRRRLRGRDRPAAVPRHRRRRRGACARGHEGRERGSGSPAQPRLGR